MHHMNVSHLHLKSKNPPTIENAFVNKGPISDIFEAKGGVVQKF